MGSAKERIVKVSHVLVKADQGALLDEAAAKLECALAALTLSTFAHVGVQRSVQPSDKAKGCT